MQPVGEFGATFKRGIGYDLYYNQVYSNENWTSRIGIYYTSLAPRLDSFPIAEMESGSNTVAHPGYAVYQKFNLIGVYIDNNVDLFTYKGLTGRIGFGILIGKTHTVSDKGVEKLWTEHSDIEELVGGTRSKVSLDYRINGHFRVYIEAMNQALVAKDWAAFYTHNNFGIGINYNFEEDDE